MSLKEWIRRRREKRYWEKYGKKKFCARVHRYLRLHSELLEDEIYRDMFLYYRKELIECYRKEGSFAKDREEEKCEQHVDILADIYSRNWEESVNEYKPVVDQLYENWEVRGFEKEDMWEKLRTIYIDGMF